MAATMTGAEKAAVLMVLLGEDASSGILQHFEEPEILAIGRAVAALGDIRPDTAERVLEEYRERITTYQETSGGGPAVARRMLDRILPPDKASRIAGAAGSGVFGVAGATDPSTAFASLNNVKSEDLAQALELEHPQIAALVLLHLEPARAATVLAGMSEEAQATITLRLSRLSLVSSEVTREVSEALAARFEAMRPEGVEERDGTGAAAEILKSMDRAKSRSILSRLESLDAACADTLRSRVYTFEILLLLNDRGIQELLKGIDSKQLALCLKGATPEVGDKFFRNMSKRASELVRDEMDILGVAKVRDVEAAQKDLLDRALKLEEEGTLTFELPEETGS